MKKKSFDKSGNTTNDKVLIDDNTVVIKVDNTAKKKKKFKWWIIPIVLIVFVIIVYLIGFIVFRVDMPSYNALAGLHQFMYFPLTKNSIDKIANSPRDYSTLPELLQLFDGTAVTDDVAFAKRKDEILSLFSQNVYGTMPKEGYTTTFNIVEDNTPVFGNSAFRKQIDISVTTNKGSSSFRMLLYVPASNKPVPVVLGLNFKGNRTVNGDEGILPSLTLLNKKVKRGKQSDKWCVNDVINGGCALASIYTDDIAPDNKKHYNERLISLFNDKNFKTIGAWSFGLMRAIDYLVTDEAINPSEIAVIGHSRLGKTALWTGANDERVALTISNDSGCSGAALSRGNKGETVKAVVNRFPHWFCDKYADFKDDVNSLPLDQHMLLACIAPRKLYVASGETDLWADPKGELTSLMLAMPAYEIYGLETISLPYETRPIAPMSAKSKSVGYHIRKGAHGITQTDWSYYIQFINSAFN